jgi:hypothetical protein
MVVPPAANNWVNQTAGSRTNKRGQIPIVEKKRKGERKKSNGTVNLC